MSVARKILPTVFTVFETLIANGKMATRIAGRPRKRPTHSIQEADRAMKADGFTIHAASNSGRGLLVAIVSAFVPLVMASSTVLAQAVDFWESQTQTGPDGAYSGAETSAAGTTDSKLFPPQSPCSASAFSSQNGASASAYGWVSTPGTTPVVVANTFVNAVGTGTASCGAFTGMSYVTSGDLRFAYEGSLLGAVEVHLYGDSYGKSFGSVYDDNRPTPFSGSEPVLGTWFASTLPARAGQGAVTNVSSATVRYTIYHPVISAALGDFNEDGSIDQIDISMLQDAVAGASTDDGYDVNSDSTVDATDLGFLLGEIVGTVAGDANLDQHVDTIDFNIVSANFGRAGIWDSGDFNRDGITDTLDFNIMSANWGYDGGSSADLNTAISVPEPSTCAIMLLALPVIPGLRRHPSRRME